MRQLLDRFQRTLAHLESPELFTLKCPDCASEIPNFQVTMFFEETAGGTLQQRRLSAVRADR